MFDVVNGLMLMIKVCDVFGVVKIWYVWLWNYVVGSLIDVVVMFDFVVFDGGFLLLGEVDLVWVGDVDRMFVLLVFSGYDGSVVNLVVLVEVWVMLDDIVCDGLGLVFVFGDVYVLLYGLCIVMGYDDSYNVMFVWLVCNIVVLGYCGVVNYYVGMSYYYWFELLGGGYYVLLIGGVLNVFCVVWYMDWVMWLKVVGLGLIVLLSYELFDVNCWNDWK